MISYNINKKYKILLIPKMPQSKNDKHFEDMIDKLAYDEILNDIKTKSENTEIFILSLMINFITTERYEGVEFTNYELRKKIKQIIASNISNFPTIIFACKYLDDNILFDVVKFLVLIGCDLKQTFRQGSALHGIVARSFVTKFNPNVTLKHENVRKTVLYLLSYGVVPTIKDNNGNKMAFDYITSDVLEYWFNFDNNNYDQLLLQ